MSEMPKKRQGPMLWLTGNRRLRRIVAILVVMPVLYVAGAGPAALFRMRPNPDLVTWVAATFYWPLDMCELRGTERVRVWLGRYLNLWRRAGMSAQAPQPSPAGSTPAGTAPNGKAPSILPPPNPDAATDSN